MSPPAAARLKTPIAIFCLFSIIYSLTLSIFIIFLLVFMAISHY